MDYQALLIEIGTEELPVEEQRIARAYLTEELPQQIAAFGWSDIEIRIGTTPRRIVIYAERFPATQPVRTEVIKGPPAHIAFDEEGKPTRALEGFLQRYDATPEAIRVETSGKKRYVILERPVPGATALEIVPKILHHVLPRIPFRKRMRWPDSPVPFSRPVRWLVALWGDVVIPWEWAGLRADRYTFGHRILAGNERIPIYRAEDYLERVQEVFVLPMNEIRRRQLERAIARVLEEMPELVPVDDPDLIDVWNHLIEWPIVIIGRFDPAFLELPEELLITAMRHHQKYLAVRNGSDRLQPYFLTPIQTRPDYADAVREGHARVLIARFRDAQFFWQEDTRRGLTAYAEELRQIVFLEKGGTFADKVARVQDMIPEVATEWALTSEERALLTEAAQYYKADLASQLVGEFPELEGIVGGLLAQHAGWDATISMAIYDHMRPQRMDDPIPRHRIGRCLAFLDRLDSLLMSLALGYRARGSSDPLGQRRWALGVIRLLIESGVSMHLPGVIARIYDRVHRTHHTHLPEWTALAEDCWQLLKSRLIAYWEFHAAPQPFIQSLIDRTPWDPWDLHQRMTALQTADPDDVYRMGLVFKRLYSITRTFTATVAVDPDRFQQPEEWELWNTFLATRERVATYLTERNYVEVVRALARLSPLLHRFFATVFVMVDDADLRNNRLALLTTIRRLFEQMADLDRWQIEVDTTY